jgi:serine/threonine protein kinase
MFKEPISSLRRKRIDTNCENEPEQKKKKLEPTLKENNTSKRVDVIEERSKETGNVLSRFIKGKLLGKGGFARCYELDELDENYDLSGKVYAGKIVERKSLQKKKTKEKFKSEILIHKSLQHKHIVQFEKYFQDEENCYIVLEICECNVKKNFINILVFNAINETQKNFK